MMAARVNDYQRILAVVDKSLAPALIHDCIQTTYVVQGWRGDDGIVAPLETVDRGEKARI